MRFSGVLQQTFRISRSGHRLCVAVVCCNSRVDMLQHVGLIQKCTKISATVVLYSKFDSLLTFENFHLYRHHTQAETADPQRPVCCSSVLQQLCKCVAVCCSSVFQQSFRISRSEHRLNRHTAAHCSTLQHTAALCSVLQHTAARYNTLQHAATHYNTQQHTATHCNTLQNSAKLCKTLQNTATHCNTLQHTTTQ